MAYTATGKKLKFGEDEVPVKPGDKEFSSQILVFGSRNAGAGQD